MKRTPLPNRFSSPEWIATKLLLCGLFGLCVGAIVGCQPMTRPDPTSSEQPAFAGGHVVHVIQPGETLSEIAVQYYGTYQKYPTVEAIMAYNRIGDARILKSGERIKIPFLIIDGTKMPKASHQGESPSPVKPEKSALQSAIRYLDAGDHAKAIPLFEKAVRENPEDEAGRRYLNMARFQKAIQDYEAGNLKAAQSGFRKVREQKTDCIECVAYLKRIDQRGESLFSQGVRSFQKQRFVQAAGTFETVREILPAHPELNEYLFKCYFEIGVDRFKTYQTSRSAADLRAAREYLEKSRQTRKSCDGCAEYEEAHKRNLYNQGIKNFTEKDSKGLTNAVKSWERVQFIDPDYKEVRKNLEEARNLLKKLKELG